MSYRSYLSLSLCLLLLSCGSKEKPQTASKPVDVTDYVVVPKTIPAVFDFIGFAESIHPVEIRARVEGYLDKIAYEEGQLVHTGDLMFQLDPRQYEAQVQQAIAEVAKEKAIYDNAVLTVDRLTPLYEKKAASKKDLDNAIASKEASAASVLAAKAQLMNNEINLGYTTITSPITGYSDRSRFHEGALINPGSNSLMTTVSVMDPIWVYFSVSDSDILQGRQQELNQSLDMPVSENGVTVARVNNWVVEAIMSDGSVYEHKGKVDYSAPTYDQTTATMMVRGVFPNPNAVLRPGQFVRIKMYGANRPNALVVPQRALVQKSNGMFVYLIDKDNKVISQDVSTGDWYGDYQIMTNGLKTGDRIVVDGVGKLRAGMTVNIVGPWKETPITPDSLSTKPSGQ